MSLRIAPVTLAGGVAEPVEVNGESEGVAFLPGEMRCVKARCLAAISPPAARPYGHDARKRKSPEPRSARFRRD